MGPLDGVRVVEFANGIHGPYAAMLLGDMGAQVIKVEPPVGDLNRSAAVVGRGAFQMGSQFYACNRNKRVMCLDLSTARGIEIALALVDLADVLIENMRPGVLDRLGLGYDVVSRRNPRLIYASATGAGPRGRRATRPSLDLVGQAVSGIVAHTGTRETGPLPVGSAIADHGGAIWLAYGVLLALYARERTGKGQHVQTSLLGSMMALQAWELSHFFLTGEEPSPAGRGHPLARGAWRVYSAADGFFVLAGVTEARWPGLCRAIGRDDLTADPRFATALQRLEYTEDLNAVLEDEFRSWPLGKLMEALETVDQVAAPVLDYTALAEDEQVQENGYIQVLANSGDEPLRMVGIPVSLSKTPGAIRSLPPELGEHTAEILMELGYNDEDIARLVEDGVAGPAH
jgi:crotonobetainyl-CoA:carnitine CoA-transferase CaiB-like acyl-CoA transferase